MAATHNRGRFTGWHATMILVGFFGTVIVVNLFMAREALATFGGIVVENSYVASQEFNGWLEQARESERLGWKATAGREGNGQVAITLAGAPAGTVLTGEARHPLGKLGDIPLSFIARGDGTYLSREELPAGRWTLRLEARLGNDVWRAEEALR